MLPVAVKVPEIAPAPLRRAGYVQQKERKNKTGFHLWSPKSLHGDSDFVAREAEISKSDRNRSSRRNSARHSEVHRVVAWIAGSIAEEKNFPTRKALVASRFGGDEPDGIR